MCGFIGCRPGQTGIRPRRRRWYTSSWVLSQAKVCSRSGPNSSRNGRGRVAWGRLLVPDDHAVGVAPAHVGLQVVGQNPVARVRPAPRPRARGRALRRRLRGGNPACRARPTRPVVPGCGSRCNRGVGSGCRASAAGRLREGSSSWSVILPGTTGGLSNLAQVFGEDDAPRFRPAAGPFRAMDSAIQRAAGTAQAAEERW